jgi:hypothetical protein
MSCGGTTWPDAVEFVAVIFAVVLLAGLIISRKQP